MSRQCLAMIGWSRRCLVFPISRTRCPLTRDWIRWWSACLDLWSPLSRRFRRFRRFPSFRGSRKSWGSRSRLVRSPWPTLRQRLAPIGWFWFRLLMRSRSPTCSIRPVQSRSPTCSIRPVWSRRPTRSIRPVRSRRPTRSIRPVQSRSPIRSIFPSSTTLFLPSLSSLPSPPVLWSDRPRPMAALRLPGPIRCLRQHHRTRSLKLLLSVVCRVLPTLPRLFRCLPISRRLLPILHRSRRLARLPSRCPGQCRPVFRRGCPRLGTPLPSLSIRCLPDLRCLSALQTRPPALKKTLALPTPPRLFRCLRCLPMLPVLLPILHRSRSRGLAWLPLRYPGRCRPACRRERPFFATPTLLPSPVPRCLPALWTRPPALKMSALPTLLRLLRYFRCLPILRVLPSLLARCRSYPEIPIGTVVLRLRAPIRRLLHHRPITVCSPIGTPDRLVSLMSVRLSLRRIFPVSIRTPIDRPMSLCPRVRPRRLIGKGRDVPSSM